MSFRGHGLRNRGSTDGLEERLLSIGDGPGGGTGESFVTVKMWGTIQVCMMIFGVLLGILSLIVIGMAVSIIYFWVDEYADIKNEVSEIQGTCCNEEYDVEQDLCDDLGAIAAFGCMANVDETGLNDSSVLVYNLTSMTWGPKPVEEACPALCTNGTNGNDGTNGTNGGDGNDGNDGGDGNDCWDINGNGLCDLQIEDVNNDGVCNQTDCIGDPGTDGVDGSNATIDECDKPFGQLYYANGTSPGDATPYILTFASADTWVSHIGLECQTSAENFINATNAGCLFTVLNNDSYKVQVDVSFATTMPPGAEIWVGVSIDGATPLLHNSFSVHSGQQDTLSFTLALALVTGDTITLQYYSKNNTGSLDIDRIQFTAVGELLCGFDVTGPQGPQGQQGNPGSDGYHCWDTNQNYFCDLATEDVNNDGVCNVTDCVLQNITYADIGGDIFFSDISGSISYGDISGNITYGDISGSISYANISGDLCVELASESIDCVADVSITAPVDGQILVFSGTGSVWENQPPVAAVVGTIVLYTSSSTLVVPAGVTTMKAFLVGGGGAGGSTTTASAGQNGAGAGGGSSAFSAEVHFVVTPGDTLTLLVGSGGIGATLAGSNGGHSIISQAGNILGTGRGGKKGQNNGGTQRTEGGNGGDGMYAGAGGGQGTGAFAAVGAAGLSLHGKATKGTGLKGGNGAPGWIASLDEFSGGLGGGLSLSGSGGGGGAMTTTPDQINLPLAGTGGNGASGVAAGPGLVGFSATRFGAGGGGASGGVLGSIGARGGHGKGGYIYLVY